jgi:N-ethylmaleimide reductase
MHATSADTYLNPWALSKNIVLQNRVVMAPMSRCCATAEHIPTDEMAIYYGLRGEAGLIVGEATMIGSDAAGYPNTPGIYTENQREGWKKVCAKVHLLGAKFFLQLWHAGMMSHPHYREGKQTISASAVAPKRQEIPRTQKQLFYGIPKAMDESDMKEIIRQFSEAAVNSITAGCDGVELHAANGYLLDSFLHYDTNRRTDDYGVSPPNMCRFVLEVVDTVIEKIGKERVGIRLSPVPLPGMQNIEEDIHDQEVFIYLLFELERRNIAFVHVSSDDDVKENGQLGMPVSAFVRRHYKGSLIGCGSYNLETGVKALNENRFDLIAFGRMFIANPNLIEIIRNSNLT